MERLRDSREFGQPRYEMAVVGSCARPSFSALSLPFGLLIVGGTRNSCDDEDDVVPLGDFH